MFVVCWRYVGGMVLYIILFNFVPRFCIWLAGVCGWCVAGVCGWCVAGVCGWLIGWLIGRLIGVCGWLAGCIIYQKKKLNFPRFNIN